MNAHGSPVSKHMELEKESRVRNKSIRSKIREISRDSTIDLKKSKNTKKYRIKKTYSSKKSEHHFQSPEIAKAKRSRIKGKRGIGRSLENNIMRVSVRNDAMLKKIFNTSHSPNLNFSKKPITSRSPKRVKRYSSSVLRLKKKLEMAKEGRTLDKISTSQRNTHHRHKHTKKSKQLFNSYFISNFKNSTSNSNVALKSLKELASSFGSTGSSHNRSGKKAGRLTNRTEKNCSNFLSKIGQDSSSQRNYTAFSHNQKWLQSNLLNKINSPMLSSEKNLFKRKNHNFFSKIKTSKAKDSQRNRRNFASEIEENGDRMKLSLIKEILGRKTNEKSKRSSQKKRKKRQFLDSINASRSRSKENGPNRYSSSGRKREKMSRFMFQEASLNFGKLGKFNFDAQKNGSIFKSLRNKIRKKVNGEA